MARLFGHFRGYSERTTAKYVICENDSCMYSCMVGMWGRPRTDSQSMVILFFF